MSESDTAPAVPTSEPRSGSEVLASLSDTERSHYQMTGELPDEKPAAPAPDPDDEPEPEPEAPTPPAATAAPVATPEKPISKRQQQINDLIRTRTEAEQKAAALEARLAALESGNGHKSAADPTAQPVEYPPIVDPNDPEPSEDEVGTKYDTYGAFMKAVARWELRQTKREESAAAERTEKAAREQNFKTYQQQRIGKWFERREAFAATEPQFRATVGTVLDSAWVQPGTTLYEGLLDSPVGPHIAWHLATHPEAFDRIVRLTPVQQVLALGRLEALYDSDSTSTTSTSASAGPAAKHVTTAPVPPVTLSARSSDPADPLDAALKDRDFRRYEAEANARDLKSSRR